MERIENRKSTIENIVLVGPAYPLRGGIAHFTEATARALREDGYHVEVVTFERQYPKLLFPGKTQLEPEPVGGTAAAAPLIDSVNPVSWWRAAQYIERLRPDMVVFQYWMPFFAPAFGTIARLLLRRGIPVTSVVHNALPHERTPLDTWLGKYFLGACDGFITLSSSVTADVRTLCGPGSPIEEVRHPVYHHFGNAVSREEARRRLGIPEESPVLLFFGYVRRYKGLHVLLDALPEIVEKLPETRLVVAGEFYEDEVRYRNQIIKSGLEDHVILHPHYVPNSQVPVYFSAADAVVQPYVSATQSGVAQVAFQFGKPVITTDVGGLAESIPHEEVGLVVPPEKPSALAEAAVRFFQEEMGEELSEGARAARDQRGWQEVAGAITKLMRPAYRPVL